VNSRLDTTFGTGGLASAGFVGGESGTGVALQPDGRIIWVGSQNTPGFPAFGTFGFAVARFNANGSPDTSFGAGGQAGVEFFSPPMQGAQEFADAVLVQPDGKILVAGSARQGQIRFAPIQGALARFNASGTLDTSFGTGGKILSSSLPGITALGLDAAGDIFTLPTLTEFSPSGQADAAVTPAAITASSPAADPGLNLRPDALPWAAPAPGAARRGWRTWRRPGAAIPGPAAAAPPGGLPGSRADAPGSPGTRYGPGDGPGRCAAR
jgi:uncharacterized delta-60 repeat protein